MSSITTTHSRSTHHAALTTLLKHGFEFKKRRARPQVVSTWPSLLLASLSFSNLRVPAVRASPWRTPPRRLALRVPLASSPRPAPLLSPRSYLRYVSLLCSAYSLPVFALDPLRRRFLQVTSVPPSLPSKQPQACRTFLSALKQGVSACGGGRVGARRRQLANLSKRPNAA
jgi:hypothetical protein